MQSPQARAPPEGSSGRGRGRTGNLPHPGSIRVPPLPRPVAPQSASYRDVVASPRRRESSAGEGREAQRRGVGGGWGRGRGQHWGRAGAGAGAAGPNSLGRALAGARDYEYAVRARRGECVCPRFPLPSPPVLRPDGAASGRQSPAAPSGSTAGCSLAAARSGTGDREEQQRRPRGSGAGSRLVRAGVGARRRESRLRVGCRGWGGCRPRPPAAQALPLFSPPTCPIAARPAAKPDRFAAPGAAAAGASAAVGWASQPMCEDLAPVPPPLAQTESGVESWNSDITKISLLEDERPRRAELSHNS
ncbi:uncharacterized protein LOC108582429 [Papio anubis]|uniref:uncharacterized protein LOC108582429 n=1 Tax=Papio anubis TaxID=9555 RepID=UPI000B7B6F41|nr:uncharacterized protein LOC108582429 [Papio anubis]